MTPEQIEAERERFEAWYLDHYDGPLEWDEKNRMYEEPWIHDMWSARLARAEIARAEQAELVAERDRLLERVRELAKQLLREYSSGTFNLWERVNEDTSGEGEAVLKLAEEAGCWFDDNGNEVPIDRWRARQGGVG